MKKTFFVMLLYISLFLICCHLSPLVNCLTYFPVNLQHDKEFNPKGIECTARNVPRDGGLFKIVNVNMKTTLPGQYCTARVLKTSCEWKFFTPNEVSHQESLSKPSASECDEALKKKRAGEVETHAYPPPDCETFSTVTKSVKYVTIDEKTVHFDPVSNLLEDSNHNISFSKTWVSTEDSYTLFKTDAEVADMCAGHDFVVPGNPFLGRNMAFPPDVDQVPECSLTYCGKPAVVFSNGFIFANEDPKINIPPCSPDFNPVSISPPKLHLDEMSNSVSYLEFKLCLETANRIAATGYATRSDLILLADNNRPGRRTVYYVDKEGNMRQADGEFKIIRKTEGLKVYLEEDTDPITVPPNFKSTYIVTDDVKILEGQSWELSDWVNSIDRFYTKKTKHHVNMKKIQHFLILDDNTVQKESVKNLPSITQLKDLISIPHLGLLSYLYNYIVYVIVGVCGFLCLLAWRYTRPQEYIAVSAKDARV